MITLQIVSYEQFGKTALCAGIGKKLVNSGKKIGYVKPLHITNQAKPGECGDALFISEALELGENKEQVCPIHISQEELWRNLSENADSFSARVKAACDAISGGKDVLIVESPGSLKNDQVSELACVTIAEKMNSKVIMLVSYSTGFKDNDILQAAKKFGDKLVGVVVNQVPESRVNAVQNEAAEYFKSQSITLLGVLPETRALAGVSVGEVAAAINGEVISSKDKAGELIENVMLGAMSPDSGRDYYNRKKNKAVVTRSERADMQLAALETSTRCLIVTGKKPNTSVMVKAEDKKVPVIVVNKEINDIIAGIEQALSQAKFQNAQKLQAMSALLDSRFDYKALNAALGI
jgi:BioD-like phosphotransacetylase family protein